MGAKLKAVSSIAEMKRHYRKIIETSNDPIESRVAQGMETALRWATEPTSGWRLRDTPRELAKLIRQESNEQPEGSTPSLPANWRHRHMDEGDDYVNEPRTGPVSDGPPGQEQNHEKGAGV